jgi:hypothetical protein
MLLIHADTFCSRLFGFFPSIVRSAEINATHVRPHQSTHTEPNESNIQSYLLQAGKIIAKGVLYFGKGIVWLALFLSSIVTGFFRFVLMAFFAATNFQGRRRTILENWSREWRSHRENIRNLSLITKLLLAASLALVVIFIGSIAVLRTQQKKALATKAYDASVQSIRDTISAAESALIYKDETEAQKNITAATIALASLPCKTSDQKATCQALTTNLETVANKQNKITTAPIQKLAEWNTGTNSLTGLIRIKNKFIAYASDSTSLFVYDLLTKQSSVVPTNYTTTGFTGAAVPKENNFVALVTNNQNVVELNPDDMTVKKVDITLPGDTSKLDSTVIYNGRLYALDANAKQIYRYEPIKTGFAIGRPWTKDVGGALDGATDITIDGDIFALKNNGQIIKFTAGVQQPFTPQTVEPKISAQARLWTYTDLLYLYVLDSQNKRLIIFDKTGALKAQIPFNDITRITEGSIGLEPMTLDKPILED